MSNLKSFDEKLDGIILHVDPDCRGLNHCHCYTYDKIQKIKQLISETIGEDEVKRDVPPNKNDSYESLNAQFKVMKYNQEQIPIRNELRKELRHAFNLKGE